MYPTSARPSSGPGSDPPTGPATGPTTGPATGGASQDPGDPVDLRPNALAHTLSIMAADSEEQLVARTLCAACELTAATLVLAVDAGGVRAYGDHTLALRLGGSGTWAGATDAQCGGVTVALDGPGVATALAVELDDVRVTAMAVPPRRFAPGAWLLLDLVVAHAKLRRDQLREVDQLCRRAERDPLTGLRNHRPFEARLAASVPGHTAVITLDLDRFKVINDTYGHQVGDRTLVLLVDALQATLRGDDQLYRIGGDEFAVVIDVAGPAEAAAVGVRLLEAARRVGHTISVGAAIRALGEAGRDTLVRADKALYEAKHAGRDTVRLAPSPKTSSTVSTGRPAVRPRSAAPSAATAGRLVASSRRPASTAHAMEPSPARTALVNGGEQLDEA